MHRLRPACRCRQSSPTCGWMLAVPSEKLTTKKAAPPKRRPSDKTTITPYRTFPAFHADNNCSYFTVSPLGFSLASRFQGAC